jgi:hypothetical protein
MYIIPKICLCVCVCGTAFFLSPRYDTNSRPVSLDPEWPEECFSKRTFPKNDQWHNCRKRLRYQYFFYGKFFLWIKQSEVRLRVYIWYLRALICFNFIFSSFFEQVECLVWDIELFLVAIWQILTLILINHWFFYEQKKNFWTDL